MNGRKDVSIIYFFFLMNKDVSIIWITNLMISENKKQVHDISPNLKKD